MDRLTGVCEIDLPAAVCAVNWAGGGAPPDPPVLHPKPDEPEPKKGLRVRPETVE